MFKNLLDLHTHTDNSPDAEHSGMILCEYAVRKGLRGIAFTDHCEVDAFYTEHYDRILRQSFFEMHKAKAVFTGKLVVCIGVELGQPSVDFELSKKILDAHPFDVVLASLHALSGEQDFYYINYPDVDVNDLLERYFQELYRIVEWNCFDVLAHLTYPLRYICGKYKIPVDMRRYDDIIDEILKLLAVNGKALEINTSGLRSEIGETSPSADIVKRFRELGGEFVTVGSDAHDCYHIGAGLEEGYQIAFDAGFMGTTLFQSHVPVVVDFAK